MSRAVAIVEEAVPRPITGGKDFSYDALTAIEAKTLRSQAERIRKSVKTSTAAIIEVGVVLILVKKCLEHGQFSKWVEAECCFSIASAGRFMRTATFAEGKIVTVTNLSATTVYEISAKSAPPAIVQDVLDRAAKGEIVSDKYVRDALDEARFQKREEDRKQKIAARRPEPKSARERLAAAEAARRQEEERIGKIASAIIKKIGEDNARFLVKTISMWDRSSVLRCLEATLEESWA
jgi:hypothetical protein